jgi:hypothetical protein
VLHEVRNTPPGFRVAFLLDDERDVNRLVVQEKAVLLLSVIAQALAVIG